jgi:hypothetical protein
MDIVSERRARTAFTDASFHTLSRNVIALVVSFVFFHVLSKMYVHSPQLLPMNPSNNHQ